MHQAAGLHQLVSDGDARPHDVVGRLGDLEADQAIQAGRGSVRKGVLDGTGRYASALMATLDTLRPTSEQCSSWCCSAAAAMTKSPRCSRSTAPRSATGRCGRST